MDGTEAKHNLPLFVNYRCPHRIFGFGTRLCSLCTSVLYVEFYKGDGLDYGFDFQVKQLSLYYANRIPSRVL